jgi:hypothetical protein
LSTLASYSSREFHQCILCEFESIKAFFACASLTVVGLGITMARFRFRRSVVAIILLTIIEIATTARVSAFAARSTFTRGFSWLHANGLWTHTLQIVRKRRPFTQSSSSSSSSSSPCCWSMCDTSASYWFSVGDSVQVVEDVYKFQTNLRGKHGTVIEVWEKCDVDPTCCCAEQVDRGMAVHVQFSNTDDDDSNLAKRSLVSNETDSFSHYFAEDELVKVTPSDHANSVSATVTNAYSSFDGMSCTAFKLQQLDYGSKPRKIASYDPSQPSDKEDTL